MLCVAAESPPEGPEWRYELKLDGFRAIAGKSGRSAHLWSRNQKDLVRRFPGVVKAIRELPDDTVIDGEIVGLDGEGRLRSICFRASGRRRKPSCTPSIC